MAKKTYNIGEENEQVEFKKSTGELKEGVISMAAILNKHGSGDLYFGVKNDGTVLGQEVNDTTLRTVSQAIGNHHRGDLRRQNNHPCGIQWHTAALSCLQYPSYPCC